MAITLEELQKIFSEAEVTVPGPGWSPMYQFYIPNGTSSVDSKNIEAALSIVENLVFAGYTIERRPVFGAPVQEKPNDA